MEEYRPLLASVQANATRVKTASEFGRREMGETGFGASALRHALFAASALRHALFAAFKTAESERTGDGLSPGSRAR